MSTLPETRIPIQTRTLLLSLVIAAMPVLSAADGGNLWGGDDKLDPVQTLIDEEDYAGAAAELAKLRAENPDDADILNLLGFTHRKQGRFDEALGYYERALAIDPEHRGALEYLGELYLQTDRPDMAERQLARLKDLCFFCRERRDLTRAIETYRESGS